MQIGASILTKDQLDMLVPDNNIINDIEVIRENAKDIVSENTNEKDIDSVLRKYNNIISILGGRGSGKTSVLLTIKEKLKCNLEQESDKKYINLLLPLIKPDCINSNIRRDDTVIGWLIGSFRDIVNKLENDIYDTKECIIDSNEKKYFYNCRKRKDNKLRSLYTELIECYLYTKRDYQDVIKREYDDFTSYVENISNSVDAQQQLIVKFYQFINELILLMRKYKDKKSEPLIFLFFDDIELSEERCGEIISTITKYLFHPNIVVLIAGDMNQFENRLLLDSLKKDNLVKLYEKDKEQLNMRTEKILNDSKVLMRNILKKVFPPALRKEIQKLTLNQKYNFVYDGENTFENLLYKIIIGNSIEENNEKIDWLIKSGFLIKTENTNRPKINKAFFNIFDNTPRSLVNICYKLNMLKGEKLNYKMIIKITNFILNNSDEFIEYKDDIYKIIRWNENLISLEENQETLKKLESKEENFNFNYNFILSKVQLMMDKTIFKKIFIFTVFIENIVSIVDSREIHGYEIINHLFNDFQIYGFKVYPEIKNTNIIIELYSELQYVQIKNYNHNSLDENYSILEYFNVLDKVAQLNNCNLVEFLNLISTEDLVWVREKADIISNQRLEKYHVMSQIIANIKNECLKMNADNSFLIKLNNKLIEIINSDEVYSNENESYEEFDDIMCQELVNYIDDNEIIIENGVIKEEKIIRYRNKVFKHLFKFSANCIVIYYINENMILALDNLLDDVEKKQFLPVELENLIKDYKEKAYIEKYKYDNLISQLDYNIKVQPQNLIYQEIKKVFINCNWGYQLQEDYDKDEYVKDFVVYILMQYLSLSKESDVFYREFKELYCKLVKNDDSYIKEYLEESTKYYRVII